MEENKQDQRGEGELGDSWMTHRHKPVREN